MKRNYEIIGTFCDNCGANLTFANHISETKNNDGTLKDPELDFCDTDCYHKFLKKEENSKIKKTK